MDTDIVFKEQNKERQISFQVLMPNFLFLFCKTCLSLRRMIFSHITFQWKYLINFARLLRFGSKTQTERLLSSYI